MKSRTCPYRKDCLSVGTCETCDFGKAIENLKNKIKKLKAKNKALQVENEELKEKIEILKHPSF